MKSELSALELHYLLKEWAPKLADARIDQIYHPTKEELYLIFRSATHKKTILRILLPKLTYLTKAKGEMPMAPGGFCMYLRKYISGALVRSVQLKGFERIIEFTLTKKDMAYSLIVELIPPGNVILCSEGKILSPLDHQDWATRTIRPGKPYVAPERKWDPRTIDVKGLQEVLAESKQDMAHTFASVLGLGGRYAEELLARSGIAKDMRTLSEKDAKGLLEHLHGLFSEKTHAQIVKKEDIVIDITPFPLLMHKGLHTELAPSYNEALDSILSPHIEDKQSIEKAKTAKTAKDKVHDIINIQRDNLSKLESAITENQRKGELIYERYAEIKELLTTAQTIRKSKGWDELKKHLKGNPLVKDIKEKEGKIILEL